MKILARLVCVALLVGCAQKTPEGSFVREATGVVVTPAAGDAKRVRLEVRSDRIVRVTATSDVNLELPASLMVLPSNAAPTQFEVWNKDGYITVKTPKLLAYVSLADGTVGFQDRSSSPLLKEMPARVLSHGVSQRFNPGSDEAFYGLGQHQNAQLNLNGEDVEIAQHNMDIGVPFVVSSRNYGVLWDNNSITRFGNPKPYGLASRDLKIRDASGKEGGFTARYSIDGALKLERVEKDINYQYIKDRFNWPKELLVAKEPVAGSPPNILPNQTVTWEGSVESAHAGPHKFQLYGSSYFKVFADDKLVLDRWRQNWAAWYQNFELPMQAGKPVKIRIEWVPNDGYIALLHNDPLPDDQRHSLTFTSEAGRAIDYYVVAGDSQNEVIAGYRELTGKAVMLPRWAYGFWQSRQRYTTQAELLGVVAEYRKRKIPLDNIVLDWFYWPEDAWGSHEFDKARFPDPKGMVDQVHAQNAHLMISVWPKFYPTTANYQELDAAGFMYRKNVEDGFLDWVGKGYKNSFYDPYSKAARDIYWRQMNEKLGVLGIDAWWMDATEPDMHSNLDIDSIKQRIGPTAIGSSTDYFNSYALVHSGGVYEGSRAARPDQRVFILTRSGFAGIQRNAAAVWSGDIASRWDDLYNQISAGVSIGYAGLPNWTFDIGGFANESRYSTQKPTAADQDEWRELNLRWFQFGAFAPLFRSHGEFPLREIYNLAPRGSEVYDSLVWHDRLRYRLLPYIYTVAADTYHRDGTIMRGLSMDFIDDLAARDVKDEYLFGNAFLVAPVYKYQARSRPVYLPAGTSWYDFHTGKRFEGGQTVEAAAPLGRMPLYVRAGSIVPVGPDLQYSSEKKPGDITLLVFPGENGTFELYEDDGVSYGYEKGEFSRIPIGYIDSIGSVVVGARSGSYPGMPGQRTFRVRLIKDGAKPADLDAKPDFTIPYEGESVARALTAP
ncbi:MAG TPA: TIM-barrel domain-containing protein [Steroidobacteraceae bacterium]|nr:TIM-barrel domain-containing protein [Steroidobacteraceae bacterium]